MKNSNKIPVLVFIIVMIAVLFLGYHRPSFHSESLSAYTNRVKQMNQQIDAVDYRMLNTALYIKLELKELIKKENQVQIVRKIGDELLKDRVFKELLIYYVETLERPGIASVNIKFDMPKSKTDYVITIEKYLATSDSELKYRVKSIESIDIKSGDVLIEEK